MIFHILNIYLFFMFCHFVQPMKTKTYIIPHAYIKEQLAFSLVHFIYPRSQSILNRVSNSSRKFRSTRNRPSFTDCQNYGFIPTGFPSHELSVDGWHKRNVGTKVPGPTEREANVLVTELWLLGTCSIESMLYVK